MLWESAYYGPSCRITQFPSWKFPYPLSLRPAAWDGRLHLPPRCSCCLAAAGCHAMQCHAMHCIQVCWWLAPFLVSPCAQLDTPCLCLLAQVRCEGLGDLGGPGGAPPAPGWQLLLLAPACVLGSYSLGQLLQAASHAEGEQAGPAGPFYPPKTHWGKPCSVRPSDSPKTPRAIACCMILVACRRASRGKSMYPW